VSWADAILPNLEQGPLYNAINFNVPIQDLGSFTPGSPWPQNTTIGLTVIRSLLCPSENLNHAVSYTGANAQTNYAANYGGPAQFASCSGLIIPAKGAFGVPTTAGVCSLASATDGTTNTALFSEHLISGGTFKGLGVPPLAESSAGRRLAKRALFQLNAVTLTYDNGNLANLQQFIAACKNIPAGTAPSDDTAFGASWHIAQGYDTATIAYTHVMTPNKFSCTGKQGGLFDFSADGAQGGFAAAITAASNHPGGVNVGMGDGSVRFIKNTVNSQVWWTLGSRNLGEVISADSY
jgi:prepilin-type processing-associated H-X9-DG protein